ncbi:MAG: RIP metalloprotease RseP [Candidatus Cloacimonetes bacterium]|nr:RIP metalloprotease RseP [Candidatus Cloacimonadota bacterium]
MTGILGAIIALGVLVTVHEAGHFAAARIFGVEVEKFSVGFGPKLLGFKKGNTEYRISLIPLGGYLKMKGENPDEKVEKDDNSFRSKKWWQRAIIAFSGPFANLILALLIFILSFLIGRSYQDNLPIIGKVSGNIDFIQKNDRILSVNDHEIMSWSEIPSNIKVDEENYIAFERDGEMINFTSNELSPESWYSDILPFVPAVIGEVSPGLPAYRSGLMQNDEILAIDSIEVHDWYEMRNIIIDSPKNRMNFRIKRADKIFNIDIELDDNVLNDTKIIGITQQQPVTIYEKFSVLQSLKYGYITTISYVAVNYAALYKLALNPSSFKDNIGGPVMIYTMSRQTAKKGFDDVLSFIGLISILLMVMNLLPIPILDGGHIFFCFLEVIFRKPFSLKTQMIFQRIGLYILMLLMVFAFFNDFSRIFSRNVSINHQRMKSE